VEHRFSSLKEDTMGKVKANGIISINHYPLQFLLQSSPFYLCLRSYSMFKIVRQAVVTSILLTSISLTSSATSWETKSTDRFGTCIIEHQVCERKFLSFDGCTPGETQSVFDIFNADCAAIVANGSLFIK
jgi:hypothetical protein